MRYQATVHHRFEADGHAFVYGATSAAVLGLDDTSNEILTHFAQSEGADLDQWRADSRQREDWSELWGTFEDMVAVGLVGPMGEVPPAVDTPAPDSYPLSTLVLNVTNKCNLSCTYCYEYGEDRITEPLNAEGKPRSPRMSLDTAKESIDFLFERSVGRPAITITFFGGETLLNFETVQGAALYALERAKETGQHVGFSLTTNATLLDSVIIDFLVEHRFGINISIDGAAGDQDRHRTFKSGKGSYDLIVPHITELLSKNRAAGGRPIGARVTLTAGASSVRDIFLHLTDELGFDSVGFAPVTSAADRDYALSDGNLGTVLAEFAELAEDYIAAALRGERHQFSNLHDLLQEVHQGVAKSHPCGAGLGLLGVSTEGELSPCHRFVESGAHAMGDVKNGLDEEKRKDFLQAGHISTKVACHDCFARPHCSGGCYHEAYVRYDDASQPNLHYCEWVRAWTDLGLRSYGRIAAQNSAFLALFEPAQGQKEPTA